MTNDTADNIPNEFPQVSEPTVEGRLQTRRDLILWLALLPVILGLLVLCGQVALMFSLGQSPANTQSLLRASYSAWVYDLIPPINIPQLIEDIQDDLRAEGIIEEPLPVVTGSFWIPPTPTGTTTPPAGFSTATLALPANTPTEANEATQTRAPSSTTSATNTATLSPTNTWAPLFTATREPEEPTATRAPARTNTAVPSATQRPPTETATSAPTATNTPVTPVPPTPEPPPVYQHISPLVANSGPNTDGEGCRAVFEYQNDNAYEVKIPMGSLNELQFENFIDLPTTFAPGRNRAFDVSWNGGGSVIWNLDGGHAEAQWCNP